MFDRVPIQVWLLLLIGLFAYGPAKYVYLYLVSSPARRDITQAPEDLSWRTPGRFAFRLAHLCALAALAVFIFTPAAVAFARWPGLMPLLLGAIGLGALSTVPVGWKRGEIQPLLKGIRPHFSRDAQPKLFWFSMLWNALLGCGMLWGSLMIGRQAYARAIEDRCYNSKNTYSPQRALTACNTLIEDRSGSVEGDLAYLIQARGRAYQGLVDYPHAMADYGEAIRLGGQEGMPYSHFNRALIYGQLHQTRREISDYDAAIRLKPNLEDALFNRAVAYAQLGEVQHTISDLNALIRVNPNDADAFRLRGETYKILGNYEQAELDLATAKRLKRKDVRPTSPD